MANRCVTDPCHPKIPSEVLWTDWHKRQPPRDVKDTRDRCAVACSVDPEKRTCKTEDALPELEENQLPKYDVGAYVDELEHKVVDLRTAYNKTAAGSLGRRRKSMLENPLLLRYDIAEQRTSCIPLPPEDFTYGHFPFRGYSAGQVITGLGGQQSSKKSGKKESADYDCTNHISMNRIAIGAGISNVKELRDYRNTHKKIFVGFSAKKGLERLPPLKVDPNKVHGKPSNYVTTAAEIMSMQEQKDWFKCIQKCNAEQFYNPPPDEFRENNAALLRTIAGTKVPEKESLWKMPKFELNAKPHLSTFRSQRALLAAHNANNLERVGREGRFGQGITTQARAHMDSVHPHKC